MRLTTIISAAFAALIVAFAHPVAAEPLDVTATAGNAPFAYLASVRATPLSHADSAAIRGAGTIIFVLGPGQVAVVKPDITPILDAHIGCLARIACILPTNTPPDGLNKTDRIGFSLIP